MLCLILCLVMISIYKYDLILIQMYIVLIWTSLRNAALRHEMPKGGSINLILFVTRFDNAHPTSRRHECSFEHPRLHGIARNLLYAVGFYIPLTSFVARLFLPRTVRGKVSPSRSLAANRSR